MPSRIFQAKTAPQNNSAKVDAHEATTPPRNFLAFCLLTLTALLAASCSSGSDSSTSDNPDTPSEASETRQGNRAVPFADQNSNSENADTSPVFAENSTPGDNPISISLGLWHSCALHQDGTISCWGGSPLGDGTGESSSVPVKVLGITDATAISLGREHYCALHQTGTISCWGSNGNGQLGNGQSGGNSSVPVKVFGIEDATAIATGDEHSCALHEDGTISCWGNNYYGQLGNGTKEDSLVPVQVLGIADATAISLDDIHSCALHQNGTITCWGNNLHGQLGNGTKEDSLVPVQVLGIADATAITTGYYHSCALHQTGTISCWGNNDDGWLGNGSYAAYLVPVQVLGITDATAISLGTSHSCALHQTGAISCWGGNSFGQLGNGQSTGDWGDHSADSSVPVQVEGIADATAITASGGHSCALHQTGTISCWGYNSDGQLGDGTEESSSVPVQVAGIADATAIIANGSRDTDHSCALHEDGAISCWGNNSSGKLGNGTFGSFGSAVPMKVAGITDATAITASLGHTCALHQNGTISCWGSNWAGQLGNGQNTGNLRDDSADSSVPV